MNKRFYPENIKPFEYEPDRDRFSIVNDEIKGNGIITLVPFYRGELVFRFTGEILAHQTLYTLQIRRGAYLHDPYFMGKVLHSCEPNMACDIKNLTFTALRDIEPEEYLTMDYETTEEVLFRQFVCSCGSEHCRGLIRGYGYRARRPSGAELYAEERVL